MGAFVVVEEFATQRAHGYEPVGAGFVQPLDGIVHVVENRPPLVVANETLDPKEAGQSHAPRHRCHLVQAGRRIEDEVTGGDLEPVAAPGEQDEETFSVGAETSGRGVSLYSRTHVEDAVVQLKIPVVLPPVDPFDALTAELEREKLRVLRLEARVAELEDTIAALESAAARR